MRTWLRAEVIRLWHTIVWSVQGWRAAWATEKTLRQWTLAQLVSIVAAFVMVPEPFMRSVVIACGFLVLAAELINTALEKAVDLLSPQPHPLAKKAKDCGSATVLLTLFAWVSVWLGVLFA